MIRPLLTIMMTIVLCMTIHAQDYTKMSPFIRQLAMQSRPSLAKCFTGNKIPSIIALAKGKQEALEPYSLTHQGDIHIIKIPVNELAMLSADPKVERIVAHEADDKTCIEEAAKIVGAPSVWEGYNLPQSFLGKGTIIGITDIGFDFTHPNFRSTEDGHIRISRVWDIIDCIEGDTLGIDNPFPIGKFYNDTTQILNALHTKDGIEAYHGTCTTGGAAGSGWGTEYRGIAPEAELYLVNSIFSNNKHFMPKSLADISTKEIRLLAWKNIFAYADSIGKPAVINFSAGGVPDLTDADSLENAFIKGITGPGKIIVASAGNDGMNDSFINKTNDKAIVGGKISTSNKYIYCYTTTKDNLLFRISKWENKNKVAEKTYRLDIKDNTTSKNANGLQLREQKSDTLGIEMDSISIHIYVAPDGFRTDRMAYEMLIYQGTTALNKKDYCISIEGDEAEAEIYIYNGSCITATDLDPSYNGAEKYLGNILSPACLPSIIAVGATAYKEGYYNQYGDYTKQSYGKEGKRATISGCGPSLHGIIKPDVMAPGTNINTSYNYHYQQEHERDTDKKVIAWTPYGDKLYPWYATSGTSISTPIVTGAIALWLEANPRLTTEDIIEIIANTSRQPDPDLSYPNNYYGNGEIDVYRGMLYALNMTGIEGLSSAHANGITITLNKTANNTLCLSFPTPTSKSVAYRIYSTNGTMMQKGNIPSGSSSTTISTAGLRGIHAVQIDGYGSTIVKL